MGPLGVDSGAGFGAEGCTTAKVFSGCSWEYLESLHDGEGEVSVLKIVFSRIILKRENTCRAERWGIRRGGWSCFSSSWRV